MGLLLKCLLKSQGFFQGVVKQFLEKTQYLERRLESLEGNLQDTRRHILQYFLEFDGECGPVQALPAFAANLQPLQLFACLAALAALPAPLQTLHPLQPCSLAALAAFCSLLQPLQPFACLAALPAPLQILPPLQPLQPCSSCSLLQPLQPFACLAALPAPLQTLPPLLPCSPCNLAGSGEVVAGREGGVPPEPPQVEGRPLQFCSVAARPAGSRAEWRRGGLAPCVLV